LGRQAELFAAVNPSASAILSAFTKSIRLRRAEDATLWFVALWRSGKSNQDRAQRRLLISAGEDCLSIPVMQGISAWYNGSSRFDLHSAIRHVLEISQTPNWYATEAGRRYILHWREAELKGNPYLEKRPDCLLWSIETAVRQRSLLRALHAFNAYYHNETSNRWKLARLLTRLALQFDNLAALAVAEVFEDNVRHIWNDANYSGQALYTLILGHIGEASDPFVSNEAVIQSIVRAEFLLSRGPTVPSWALDGIHCSGSDPRFAGTLKQMCAMCRAYEYYGRLDPADEFLPEFYEKEEGSNHNRENDESNR